MPNDNQFVNMTTRRYILPDWMRRTRRTQNNEFRGLEMLVDDTAVDVEVGEITRGTYTTYTTTDGTPIHPDKHQHTHLCVDEHDNQA